VCALADAGKRIGIPQQDVEDLLTVELGITQEDTMRKNVNLMVRLGYLKVARRGLSKEGMSYDLVGKRVAQEQEQRVKAEAFEDTMRVRRRR